MDEPSRVSGRIENGDCFVYLPALEDALGHVGIGGPDFARGFQGVGLEDHQASNWTAGFVEQWAGKPNASRRREGIDPREVGRAVELA